MNGLPNRANEPKRIIQHTSWFEMPDKMPGEGTPGSTTSRIPVPKPRSATEAMKIVGEGNMGANVPMSRKGAPKKSRKGRAK